MATYYVRKSGNDSNNGLGPSSAWLTVGKALGSSGISSGDTVYIGAGTYAETITVAMTNATAETHIIGDVDGAHTGDAGYVNLYSSSATAILNLSARNYLTFKKLRFIRTGNAITATPVTSTNIKFHDCSFIQEGAGNTGVTISLTVGFGVAANWEIKRCAFFENSGVSFSCFLTTGTGSDWDSNILIENCRFISKGSGITVSGSGSSPNKGGGLVAKFCTFVCGTSLAASGTNLSLTYPCSITNSLIRAGANAGVSAGELGSVVESYNIFWAGSARVNVSIGTGSSTAQLFDVSVADEELFGRLPRPLFMPNIDADILNSWLIVSTPLDDFLSQPRIATTLGSVGCLQPRNVGVKVTSPVNTGPNALRIVGAGFHDIYVPVDDVATTLSVYARWEGTYSGTKPRLHVLNGAAIGVADAFATMTAGSTTWEKLTLSFTPTAKGFVIVRLQALSTEADSDCFFDDLEVTV
jgi:hypothetical protein